MAPTARTGGTGNPAPAVPNLIVVMLDSLRQDHVGAYHQGRPAFAGVAPCQTPHLDRFAAQSLRFENAYPEAFPTIPVRTALMTGQRTLPFRPWQPLLPSDVTVAEILRRHAFVNGLISDTYHYRAPGMNFHRGFHAYRWVRGQEYDPYESGPARRALEEYVNANYPPLWRGRIAQFLANTDAFARREDWFAPQVVEQACAWLERNRSHDHVFLWIDSFDPHEPWDPPGQFDHYTDPAYTGRRLIMPMGGRAADWASEARSATSGASTPARRSRSTSPWASSSRPSSGWATTTTASSWCWPTTATRWPTTASSSRGPTASTTSSSRCPSCCASPAAARRRAGAGHGAVPRRAPHPPRPDGSGAGDPRHARPLVPRGRRGPHRRPRESCVTGYHAGADRVVRHHDADTGRQWSLILRPEGEPDELYDLAADPRERDNRIDAQHDVAARLLARFGPTYFRRQRPLLQIKGVQGAYEVASGAVE